MLTSEHIHSRILWVDVTVLTVQKYSIVIEKSPITIQSTWYQPRIR